MLAPSHSSHMMTPHCCDTWKPPCTRPFFWPMNAFVTTFGRRIASPPASPRDFIDATYLLVNRLGPPRSPLLFDLKRTPSAPYANSMHQASNSSGERDMARTCRTAAQSQRVVWADEPVLFPEGVPKLLQHDQMLWKCTRRPGLVRAAAQKSKRCSIF